ncbi:hypothetical protein KFE25_001417 [Diacronema lutheri]|uniref:DUF6816 domain-containing protein n=1 Tax=Diacronema lutheri TaxID=2081491 RepID=A0A8J6C6B1_DIALT|nr:hypothetical protein KFE25_001417 [Diacronema lutheri]
MAGRALLYLSLVAAVCRPTAGARARALSRRLWVGSAASAALAARAPRGRAADAPPRDLRDAVERTVADALAGGARDLTVYARPTYGRESDDIYYPPWLAGEWLVSSKQTGLVAPLGAELFGPTGAYERARAALDEPALAYRARFARVSAAPGGGGEACVCERPFTVASISRAAMGADAVLAAGGVAQPDGALLEGATSADELEVRLRPSGAGGRTFRVQLQVVGRSARATGDGAFECAELTRQTVFAEGAAQRGAYAPAAAPSVKEIETTSTYDLQPSGRVLSRQRTATFLVADGAYTLPSSDLAALARARAAGRYAVDVRTYELQYARAAD